MLRVLLLGEVNYFGVAFDLGLGGVRTWGVDEETVKTVKLPRGWDIPAVKNGAALAKKAKRVEARPGPPI